MTKIVSGLKASTENEVERLKIDGWKVVSMTVEPETSRSYPVYHILMTKD